MPSPPPEPGPAQLPAEARQRNTDRIILGVDPGTQVTGYAFIQVGGRHPQLLSLGVIELKKLADHPMKLKRIFDRLLGMIEAFLPDEMAIEAPFQGKNVQSMLKLGRAQGVAIAAALQRDVPVVEYAPTKVKMAVTGRGAASKAQVAGMLAHLMPELKQQGPLLPDATDALAVALCHYLQSSGGLASPGRYSGWEAFVKQNPGRKRG
ncbi:MAG: crossover junction endodeoxyribonuclease RuvC [Bacteroidetes bacterium]|jgi:crossover junction endodeoxyribonuclease RuvC|nr:crossover junction endodeoxyribonuclease RuvC [Bacteroidota bacterium]